MNDDDDYILASEEINDNLLMQYDRMRPTIIVETKKNIFKNMYHSKWANLKLFLQEKKSLESSIKLQKQKTIEQFSSKCQEIYKKKVEIQLITKKNRQMFKSYNSNNEETVDKDIKNIDKKIFKLKIIDKSEEFEKNSVKDFLFSFRENNALMLRLIECADNQQCEIIVPFLCHFFYENFYMESTEQEEILYIIYFLLEKEIDSLYTPSVSTFLAQSFISKFLTEMGNRYEIKHYIDIILNYLIMNIEEQNITYNSLDILGNKKGNELEDIYYDMSNENGVKNNCSEYFYGKSASSERNDTSKNIQISEKLSIVNIKEKKSLYISSSKMQKDNMMNLIKNNTVLMDNINNMINSDINLISKVPLKKEINPDLFNNINEKFIRDRMEKETDEIMKHFFVRQLRKLRASKNPDLFNGNQYYEKIKKQKKIFKSRVMQFNKSYTMIIDFINELLTNLENNTIIPYSIKVISKFIDILLKKKFKNISKIQCNILICQFLFDKLIFPVLQNPDINDAGKDMIISFNTRKSLSNIYAVCKKLVRGELFSIEDKDYLVIFNKFIINNYHRINNIIDKLINVSIPKKLTKLTEVFYNNDSFNLEDVKRKESSINYDYFEENPNDFMQHKSICFSIRELLTFYKIVNNNKERFIQEGSTLQKIYKDLSENIINLEKKKYDYYVIISDEYNDEIRELLSNNDIKIPLGKTSNIEDIIKNIKYCISHLISNIEIYQNWKWVRDSWDTIRTFQFIHNYLVSNHLDAKNYMKKDKVPLSWYSLYIINNIKKIKNDYCLNDYDKLYESLEKEMTVQLKKLRKLNNFLTVNMCTKFLLIDHKIKIFNQELNNVKSTELNIKTVQFIERTKIGVCLTTIDEINFLSKYVPISLDSLDMNSQHKLILSLKNKKISCIHRAKIDQKNYKINKEAFNKNHCKNINQFCLHLADYYSIICEDIIGKPKTNTEETPLSRKTMVKSQTSKNLLKKRTSKDIFSEIRESSSKEIVEKYMQYLSNLIKDSTIFNIDLSNNSEEYRKKIENDKKEALHIIWNYILKTLCIRICENEQNEKDKSFRKICKKLSWIKHEDLNISNEVFNKQLFFKAEYHIKKMDSLRTPGGMLHQFGLAVNLINSMFVFMLSKDLAEADDLLPMIIYAIILARPKRIIFNIKFIKYFMNQNQLLGNIGYNLIQAESSTRFIQNMTGKDLKMDEQEFEDKCKLNMQLKDINKDVNNINSINDTEEHIKGKS